MSEDAESIPFVAVGTGEAAPWQKLSLDCPDCGAACELQRSWDKTNDRPGSLQFITCAVCREAGRKGGPWLRGPMLPDGTP